MRDLYFCDKHGRFHSGDCADCIEEEIRVPDALGEVGGWRAWFVVPALEDSASVRLTSLGYGGQNTSAVWDPGEPVVAACARGHSHPAPDERCTCGFYAARTRDHLIGLGRYHRYERHGQVTVIGEVAMSGKVIPGTQGWRAEKVRPVRVQVPYELWRWANLLTEVYGPDGVEVTLDNTLAPPDGPAA